MANVSTRRTSGLMHEAPVAQETDRLRRDLVGEQQARVRRRYDAVIGQARQLRLFDTDCAVVRRRQRAEHEAQSERRSRRQAVCCSSCRGRRAAHRDSCRSRTNHRASARCCARPHCRAKASRGTRRIRAQHAACVAPRATPSVRQDCVRRNEFFLHVSTAHARSACRCSPPADAARLRNRTDRPRNLRARVGVATPRA